MTMNTMDKCNGCGAMSGWLSWVKPPHHQFFKAVCDRHDELYIKGDSKEDRLKADIRLFQDMVKHSITYFKGRKVASQMWFIFLSYLYYICVRMFGSNHFNYIKR